MARPIKTGLDYFPKDTGSFSDRKVKRLLHAFGSKGYTIFDYLLCVIYSDKGYYVEYDGDLAFDVADALGDGISENLVKEVVTYCCKVMLFNQQMLESKNILTSNGIQTRYLMAKPSGVILSEYGVIDDKTRVIDKETPVFNPISTQSKVKESKEKESKVIPAPPDGEEKELVWNTMPGPEYHFLELPEIKIGAVQELLKISKGISSTPEQIRALWAVFKVQHLNGKKFYAHVSDVHSHFMNWSRTQQIAEINKNMNTKPGKSAEEIRRELQENAEKEREARWQNQ